MKILSLEDFLKSYNIDIYDFISYIDDTQLQLNSFKNIYNEVIIKYRVTNDVPIQISKKYVKNNVNLYKKYFFNNIPSSQWIVKAFAFSNKALNIKEIQWYDISIDWQTRVRNYKKVIVFNSDQGIKNQKIENLKI